MNEYYIYINDSEQGPYTLSQLATMNIAPSTDVWCEGMSDWAPASSVPQLASLFQPVAQPVVTTPPQYSAPVYNQPPQHQPVTAPVQQPTKRQRSGCLLWGLLVLFVVLIVLAVTVPSRRDHLDTVQDATREWVNATVNEGLGGNILGEFAKWIGASGTDFLLEKVFFYDNYFVCSVGRIEIGETSKMVSFGILGHVFTFDKDDINEVIKRAMDGNNTLQQEVIPQGNSYENPSQQPVAPEDIPTPEEVSPDGNAGDVVKDYIDTMAQHLKDEAVRSAKEWAKKKIDEM